MRRRTSPEDALAALTLEQVTFDLGAKVFEPVPAGVDGADLGLDVPDVAIAEEQLLTPNCYRLHTHTYTHLSQV